MRQTIPDVETRLDESKKSYRIFAALCPMRGNRAPEDVFPPPFDYFFVQSEPPRTLLGSGTRRSSTFLPSFVVPGTRKKELRRWGLLFPRPERAAEGCLTPTFLPLLCWCCPYLRTQEEDRLPARAGGEPHPKRHGAPAGDREYHRNRAQVPDPGRGRCGGRRQGRRRWGWAGAVRGTSRGGR